jgi:hypothetical protein
MSGERFNHAYTHLLILSLLSYEMRDRPWWTVIVVIVACATFAILISFFGEARKEE